MFTQAKPTQVKNLRLPNFKWKNFFLGRPVKLLNDSLATQQNLPREKKIDNFWPDPKWAEKKHEHF